MSLSVNIRDSIVPLTVQDLIREHFWASKTTHSLQSYFSYFTQQSRIALQGCSSHLTVRTYQDIVDIASDMLLGSPRAEVKERLLARKAGQGVDQSEEALNASIDLAVRLVVMIEVGEWRNAFSGRHCLIWTDGSLSEFVHSVFLRRPQLGHEGVKLDKAFKACNLLRIAGVRVELTTNLWDHLRFRDDTRTVGIFHHASFLKCQHE
jgi:hypothetical protein